MSEFGQTALSPSEALELAAYAIWSTSSVDPMVGGQVQAALVNSPRKGGVVQEVTGEAYMDVVEATITKKRLLQAFWHVAGDKSFRASVEMQLRSMTEKGEGSL